MFAEAVTMGFSEHLPLTHSDRKSSPSGGDGERFSIRLALALPTRWYGFQGGV